MTGQRWVALGALALVVCGVTAAQLSLGWGEGQSGPRSAVEAGAVPGLGAPSGETPRVPASTVVSLAGARAAAGQATGVPAELPLVT